MPPPQMPTERPRRRLPSVPPRLHRVLVYRGGWPALVLLVIAALSLIALSVLAEQVYVHEHRQREITPGFGLMAGAVLTMIATAWVLSYLYVFHRRRTDDHWTARLRGSVRRGHGTPARVVLFAVCVVLAGAGLVLTIMLRSVSWVRVFGAVLTVGGVVAWRMGYVMIGSVNAGDDDVSISDLGETPHEAGDLHD